MFNLPNYLARYRLLANQHSANKKAILEILASFNFNLEPNQIEVKNKVLQIKTKPIIKSELFLRKADLLASFQTNLNGQITDLK